MTSEDIVTDILTNRAILKRSEETAAMMYAINPQYDLTNYLNKIKSEPSRFGPKYIFVK